MPTGRAARDLSGPSVILLPGAPAVREGSAYPDQARIQINVGSFQRGHLAPPQASEGAKQGQGAEPAVILIAGRPVLARLPQRLFGISPRPE